MSNNLKLTDKKIERHQVILTFWPQKRTIALWGLRLRQNASFAFTKIFIFELRSFLIVKIDVNKTRGRLFSHPYELFVFIFIFMVNVDVGETKNFVCTKTTLLRFFTMLSSKLAQRHSLKKQRKR